jgi:hypothetical protein
MILMGAALFPGTAAYAANDPVDEIISAITENLTIDAVWLTGDILNIEVTDKLTGLNQTLRLPLDEYAGNSEYVSVQAVDRNGNVSNTIQFRNPFYIPGADTTETPGESGIPADGLSPGGVNPSRPFTPDGTGTVIDNVTDGDGKEFFSIETEDGNVFYLIVDRQRSSENVYLLNAVTEEDLMSLAKEGDGKSGGTSGIPAETPAPATPAAPTEPAEPEPPATPANSGGMGSGSIIFIVIGVIVVGGAGYYFKIVKPKKQAADDGGYDDYDEDADYGEDYGESGAGEDGDGE